MGLHDAGYDLRLAFDNDPASVNTYNHNLEPRAVLLDASQVSGHELLEFAGLSPGELHLFSGGPPCQGFSKQRRGAVALEDPRNRLVVDFVRLVKETATKAFLFENVEIFGQKRGRLIIEEVSEQLSGYQVYTFFVCSSDFGLAQTRGRFLMIGLQRDLDAPAPLLQMGSDRRTVRDVIGDLPPPPDNFSEHPKFANHQKCKITALNELRFSHVPPGGGWQDIPWHLRLPCHQKVDITRGGWPDVYGRLEWDRQCPTITGGFDSFTRGRYGHPEQNRSLTPREAARLQGFPDRFRFLGNRTDVRRMIGNAMPPPLAREAASAVARSLGAVEPEASSRIMETWQETQTL